MKWRGFFLHVLVGVLGTTCVSRSLGLTAAMIGIPHADTYFIGPTYAVPLLLGLAAGSFAAWQDNSHSMIWVWIPFAFILVWGIADAAIIPGGTLRTALFTYFAGFGGDEALGQVLITSPFVVSAAYSTGAKLNLYFRLRQRGTDIQ